MHSRLVNVQNPSYGSSFSMSDVLSHVPWERAGLTQRAPSVRVVVTARQARCSQQWLYAVVTSPCPSARRMRNRSAPVLLQAQYKHNLGRRPSSGHKRRHWPPVSAVYNMCDVHVCVKYVRTTCVRV